MIAHNEWSNGIRREEYDEYVAYVVECNGLAMVLWTMDQSDEEVGKVLMKKWLEVLRCCIELSSLCSEVL